jgi:hypothetical protein
MVLDQVVHHRHEMVVVAVAHGSSHELDDVGPLTHDAAALRRHEVVEPLEHDGIDRAGGAPNNQATIDCR